MKHGLCSTLWHTEKFSSTNCIQFVDMTAKAMSTEHVSLGLYLKNMYLSDRVVLLCYYLENKINRGTFLIKILLLQGNNMLFISGKLP